MKADGKRYQFRLYIQALGRTLQYSQSFDTSIGTNKITLPISGFKATWRGRTIVGAPNVQSDWIKGFGILIADKQTGSFELSLESVSAH